MKWFDRTFQFETKPGVFPVTLERLRGMPSVLQILTVGLTPDKLTRRLDHAWSIQENIGHLLDLEPLWSDRITDLMEGVQVLRPADLRNTKTHEAGHNRTPVQELLASFRVHRKKLLVRLDNLSPDQQQLTSLHPRLKIPMSTLDLCLFIAEHDDHHVARIRQLTRLLA